MLFPSLLLASALAGPADYVVLFGFPKSDPYHAAAQKLADHHKTQALIRFDPENPDRVLSKLKKIAPRHVAIVLRPGQIDVNTVRGILRMSTKIDKDPFVDFEFGYITGSTAKAAETFVDNIIRASKKKQPKTIGRCAVSSAKKPSWAQNGQLQLGKARFKERALYCTHPEGDDHGRDQAFIDTHLGELEGLGAIMMGGHGMPWEISSGPAAEDVAKVDLFPAVAFNYACHTGVTARYPEWQWGSINKSKLEDLGEKISFALSIIDAGITGYVAYVNPRPAGPELSIDYHCVLTGSSLGEARERDYDKILLGYMGYGETEIVPPVVGKGSKGIPRAEFDTVRHMMLDAATGGILYGDPAARPFKKSPGSRPLQTEVKRAGKGLRATMTVEGQWTGIWCNDPLRGSKEKKGRMAQKIYDRVELPAKLSVTGVTVISAKRGGQDMAAYEPLWAIEEDGDDRFLHVKVNFEHAPGNYGTIEVELDIAGKKRR